MGNAVCTYLGEDAPRLGDFFWGRVSACGADRSVSFHVGGAAVVLIIVGAGIITYGGGCCGGGTGLRMNDDGLWRTAGLDDLHPNYTYIPHITGPLALSLSRR